MMDKYATPLLIVREVGTLLGKTRFQKLACLLSAESQRRGLPDIGLRFELYLHGPYSRELSKTVDELVRAGLLVESSHATPAGNLQYVYTLSRQGEDLVDGLVSSGFVPQTLVDSTRDVVREAAYFPLPELIDRAYQAFNELQPS